MTDTIIKNELLNQMLSGASSRSFLISGMKGSNKAQMVRQTVNHLLNINSLDAHPNLLWIDTTQTEIKVEDIRNMCKFIYSTAFHSKLPKIAVINGVDTLNIYSLNALLKPLEDLPKNTFFVLIANNAKILPATILSRCAMIRMNIKYKENDIDRKLYQSWIHLICTEKRISFKMHEFIDKNFSSQEQLEMFKNFINHLLHKSIKLHANIPVQEENQLLKGLSSRGIAELYNLLKFSNSLLEKIKSIGLNSKSVVLIITNRLIGLAL